MMSLASLRTQVPIGMFEPDGRTWRVTVSGPPDTPLNVCLKVYQPDWLIWTTGACPGSAGLAPQRVALLPPVITKPSGSVPTLNTKSRLKFPDGSLIAEDQSKRVSGWLIAYGTSR